MVLLFTENKGKQNTEDKKDVGGGMAWWGMYPVLVLLLSCMVLLGLLHLDLNSLLNMRPAVDARNSSKRGADPVNNKELHWCVATATKFETGSKDGVEVSAAGGESSTDHAGGNKTVNGNSMLGFF